MYEESQLLLDSSNHHMSSNERQSQSNTTMSPVSSLYVHPPGVGSMLPQAASHHGYNASYFAQSAYNRNSNMESSKFTKQDSDNRQKAFGEDKNVSRDETDGPSQLPLSHSQDFVHRTVGAGKRVYKPDVCDDGSKGQDKVITTIFLFYLILIIYQ